MSVQYRDMNKRTPRRIWNVDETHGKARKSDGKSFAGMISVAVAGGPPEGRRLWHYGWGLPVCESHLGVDPGGGPNPRLNWLAPCGGCPL